MFSTKQGLGIFKTHIESTRHLIIPSLSGGWPCQLYFPNATELTVVGWNKELINSYLDPRKFPSTSRINYLCNEPLPFRVGLDFTLFPYCKFYEYTLLGLNSRLAAISEEQKGTINYIKYRQLMAQGTNKEYINAWNKFMVEFKN
jgi:hypothetical protein